MNEKKFCIIICTNNKRKLAECVHYLEHLIIPEGYELDFLAIEDAASITSGYNEGMAASDAKYKIYMHQDVLVLNKNLLSDLLTIFDSDEQIGMIGLTGYKTVSADGMMWHSADRIGNPYSPSMSQGYPALSEYKYDPKSDGIEQVALADGYFLATSCDYPWNEEHLDGWDFYDAFKSIQLLEAGKKVVVPIQKHPWCLHDDGYVLYLKNYDKYRKIFCTKYEKYLGKHISELHR